MAYCCSADVFVEGPEVDGPGEGAAAHRCFVRREVCHHGGMKTFGGI